MEERIKGNAAKIKEWIKTNAITIYCNLIYWALILICILEFELDVMQNETIIIPADRYLLKELVIRYFIFAFLAEVFYESLWKRYSFILEVAFWLGMTSAFNACCAIAFIYCDSTKGLITIMFPVVGYLLILILKTTINRINKKQ